MALVEVGGDLLAQDVAALVNAWNRNIVPWWLLRPSGVAGAIRRRAGSAPFRELAACGVLAPGQAVITGAGKLPQRAIIHVAAISPWGRSSPALIRDSVINAVALARSSQLESLAFPVLGSGSGGVDEERAAAIMREALAAAPFAGRIVLVRFQK